jgi:hypothetical protein
LERVHGSFFFGSSVVAADRKKSQSKASPLKG